MQLSNIYNQSYVSTAVSMIKPKGCRLFKDNLTEQDPCKTPQLIFVRGKAAFKVLDMVNYFNNVEQLCVLFSGSTTIWNILNTYTIGNFSLKSLSTVKGLRFTKVFNPYNIRLNENGLWSVFAMIEDKPEYPGDVITLFNPLEKLKYNIFFSNITF